MPETTVVHIGENSAEQVAYKLMEKISLSEAKAFNPNPVNGYTTADRKWILDTYAQCLHTLRSPHSRL